MADFLTRLAERTLGIGLLAQPIVAPRFAQKSLTTPSHLGDELLTSQDEVAEMPTAGRFPRRDEAEMPTGDRRSKLPQHGFARLGTPENLPFSIPTGAGEKVSGGEPIAPLDAQNHVNIPDEENAVGLDVHPQPSSPITPLDTPEDAVGLDVHPQPSSPIAPLGTQNHVNIPDEEDVVGLAVHPQPSSTITSLGTPEDVVGLAVHPQPPSTITPSFPDTFWEEAEMPTAGRFPRRDRVQKPTGDRRSKLPLRGSSRLGTPENLPFSIPTGAGEKASGREKQENQTRDERASDLPQPLASPEQLAEIKSEAMLHTEQQTHSTLSHNASDHPNSIHLPNTLSRNGRQSSTQQSPTRPVAEEATSTPTIHVTIGRIDVRAITPPPPTPRSQPEKTRPTLSLEDYTRQRKGGRP